MGPRIPPNPFIFLVFRSKRLPKRDPKTYPKTPTENPHKITKRTGTQNDPNLMLDRPGSNGKNTNLKNNTPGFFFSGLGAWLIQKMVLIDHFYYDFSEPWSRILINLKVFMLISMVALLFRSLVGF